MLDLELVGAARISSKEAITESIEVCMNIIEPLASYEDLHNTRSNIDQRRSGETSSRKTYSCSCTPRF